MKKKKNPLFPREHSQHKRSSFRIKRSCVDGALVCLRICCSVRPNVVCLHYHELVKRKNKDYLKIITKPKTLQTQDISIFLLISLLKVTLRLPYLPIQQY